MAASMIGSAKVSTLLNFATKLRKIDVLKPYVFSGGNYRTQRLYSEKNADTESTKMPAYRHYPGKWDKLILVWTKKYPSVNEIPEYVTHETIDKARNKARIYINVLAVGVTIIGCYVVIKLGKAKAKSGDSVQKRNLDWHKEINEQTKSSN